MMIDLFSALFGGVLVGTGTYVGAHIANVVARRAPREPRESTPRIPRERRRAIPGTPATGACVDTDQVVPLIPGMPDTHATKALGNDVVKALTTSGYGKAEAALAVAACSGSERSTIDAWLRAALKKLSMRGALA